jgi:hypothetical protein
MFLARSGFDCGPCGGISGDSFASYVFENKTDGDLNLAERWKLKNGGCLLCGIKWRFYGRQGHVHICVGPPEVNIFESEVSIYFAKLKDISTKPVLAFDRRTAKSSGGRPPAARALPAFRPSRRVTIRS